MESIKNFLEIVYFLSGPALVAIAYIALGQIKVARSQIEEQRKATRISAQRDALKLTSEQIREYGLKIIPLLNILDKAINDNNIKFFEKSEIIINDNSIKVKPYTSDNELKKIANVINEFLNVMNALGATLKTLILIKV